MTDDQATSSDTAGPLARLESIVDDVFEQADPLKTSGHGLTSDDDICPLYCAISRIKTRYESLELIGRGGMKEVYRVYDAKAARHAALAKPRPEFSRDHFDAFLREAHLTARLDHPNIIDLFDMGVDAEGRPFFTMELKLGRSLRDVINGIKKGEQETEFPLHRRLEIFQKVCDAIAYAHSRRVLHLDIKPENIFVGDFGEVKVCDWGMGVVMAREKDQSESTVLLDPDLYGSLLDSAKGTPIYMSPEQKDRRKTKTPRMDIYSMGCLLGELLTLEVPTTDSDALTRVDPALAATVRKATKLNPEDRYPKIEDLREDIARFLSGYSTSVESPSLRREAALFYRRHRETCSIAIGLFAIFTICVAYFVIQLRLSRQDAVEARDRAEKAQAAAETSQKQAEDSLSRYLAEKRASQEREMSQVLSAINHSDFITDAMLLRTEAMPAAIDHALQQIKTIIQFDPLPESKVWLQTFYLHFLTQDFDAALALSEEGKVIDLDLVHLAEKYQTFQDDNGNLTTDDFIALIRDLCQHSPGKPQRGQLAEKMIIFDSLQRNAIEDLERVTNAWIHINNPNWDPLQFSFDPETETVRLRGSKLVRLVRRFPGRLENQVPLSLLYILRPKVLDIRETGLKSMEGLAGLNLEELDIRDTAITDLTPLLRKHDLNRLHILPGQLSELYLEQLPETVEVFMGN